MSLCFVWKLPPHCDCQSFARVRQYRRRGFSELLQREFRERETREGRSVYDLFLGYGVHRFGHVSPFFPWLSLDISVNLVHLVIYIVEYFTRAINDQKLPPSGSAHAYFWPEQ
jgi:hypothetical protein